MPAAITKRLQALHNKAVADGHWPLASASHTAPADKSNLDLQINVVAAMHEGGMLRICDSLTKKGASFVGKGDGTHFIRAALPHGSGRVEGANIPVRRYGITADAAGLDRPVTNRAPPDKDRRQETLGAAQLGRESMEIRIDDLKGPEIAALLSEHLECMAQVSPRESRHALDLEGLRHPAITFWTVWDGPKLAGCGALKEIDRTHGEVKSMRTSATHLRRGVASKLLHHILAVAQRRGYRRVSLETGSMAYFEPARNLYRKTGFTECEAFAGYQPDPNSSFFTREI